MKFTEMKRLLVFLGVTFLPLLLMATDVHFNLAAPYFNANPATNRIVTLQPMSPFPGNLIWFTSDTNGCFTFSNIWVGDFSGVIKAPPGQITFQISVTATNLGLIEADSITSQGGIQTHPSTGKASWTIQAADQRYQLSGTTLSNTFYPLFSNPSNYVARAQPPSTTLSNLDLTGANTNQYLPGANITLTTNGNAITIASTGGGGLPTNGALPALAGSRITISTTSGTNIFVADSQTNKVVFTNDLTWFDANGAATNAAFKATNGFGNSVVHSTNEFELAGAALAAAKNATNPVPGWISAQGTANTNDASTRVTAALVIATNLVTAERAALNSTNILFHADIGETNKAMRVELTAGTNAAVGAATALAAAERAALVLTNTAAQTALAAGTNAAMSLTTNIIISASNSIVGGTVAAVSITNFDAQLTRNLSTNTIKLSSTNGTALGLTLSGNVTNGTMPLFTSTTNYVGLSGEGWGEYSLITSGVWTNLTQAGWSLNVSGGSVYERSNNHSVWISSAGPATNIWTVVDSSGSSPVSWFAPIINQGHNVGFFDNTNATAQWRSDIKTATNILMLTPFGTANYSTLSGSSSNLASGTVITGSVVFAAGASPFTNGVNANGLTNLNATNIVGTLTANTTGSAGVATGVNSGNTLTVDPTGTNLGYRSTNAPYALLSQAVAVAHDGDEIKVNAGNYFDAGGSSPDIQFVIQITNSLTISCEPGATLTFTNTFTSNANGFFSLASNTHISGGKWVGLYSSGLALNSGFFVYPLTINATNVCIESVILNAPLNGIVASTPALQPASTGMFRNDIIYSGGSGFKSNSSGSPVKWEIWGAIIIATNPPPVSITDAREGFRIKSSGGGSVEIHNSKVIISDAGNLTVYCAGLGMVNAGNTNQFMVYDTLIDTTLCTNSALSFDVMFNCPSNSMLFSNVHRTDGLALVTTNFNAGGGLPYRIASAVSTGTFNGDGSGLTNLNTVYTTNTTYTIAPAGLAAALALFAVQTNQVITTRTP